MYIVSHIFGKQVTYKTLNLKFPNVVVLNDTATEPGPIKGVMAANVFRPNKKLQLTSLLLFSNV